MPTLRVPVQGSTVVAEGAGPAANAAPPTVTPEAPDTLQVDSRHLNAVRFPRPTEIVDDTSGYEWAWDKHGKGHMVMKAPPEGDATPDGTQDEGDIPTVADLPQQTAAPTSEVSELRTQVLQLTQAVGLLLQQQGAPALPQAPALPTPPDPTQFDFYDPAQLAEFQRLNTTYTQALVKQEVNAALEPHGDTLRDARWQTQFNGVLAQHGKEPNFTANADAAIQLVTKFPNRFSIPEAYEIVSGIQPTSPQQPAAPVARPQQPARTLTQEQADAKAAQAARLPKPGNGVSSAGRAALPAHIKGLGQIANWNRQHGRG